jgi:hypothetical protein
MIKESEAKRTPPPRHVLKGIAIFLLVIVIIVGIYFGVRTSTSLTSKLTLTSFGYSIGTNNAEFDCYVVYGGNVPIYGAELHIVGVYSNGKTAFDTYDNTVFSADGLISPHSQQMINSVQSYQINTNNMKWILTIVYDGGESNSITLYS